jgi:hypothetical protein
MLKFKIERISGDTGKADERYTMISDENGIDRDREWMRTLIRAEKGSCDSVRVTGLDR